MSNKEFSQLIINWQKQHGRHGLPWQKNKTAYRIWVSEIMLQQTQVSTVIPYYQRFMRTFPSLKQLAMADENAVLQQWTGLGYYRRAQNLHRCAKIIVKEHSGRFPQSQEKLEALPGIGRSTAAAIASFAFNQNTCILDGNVKRILARAFIINEDVKKTTVQKKLWALAEELKPENNTAIYNQGLMDLGSTICTRNQPNCDQCPIQIHCLAYQDDVINNYPIKSQRIKKNKQSMYLLNIRYQNKHLLIQRPKDGIWAKLWSFPYFKDKETLQQWSQLNLNQEPQPVYDCVHQLTHQELYIYLYQIELSCNIELSKLEGIWYDQRQEAPGGLPKPIQRALQKMETS